MNALKDMRVSFVIEVDDVRIVNEDAEDYLLGTATICGTSHHFEAVRVMIGTDGIQRPTRDPHGRFEDLQKLNAGYLTPTKIPGFDGDWVVYITPYVD